MRAGIYARVSIPRQARAQKIDEQLERMEAHIEEKGFTLEKEHIYLDEGYSGSSLSRPGLDHLRDAAAMAEFKVLLVTAPDRLARKYIHQVLLIEELQGRGCQVEFMERPMSQDPNDQLLLQIRGAVAEYERTLITERMRRGRLAKLRAGQLLLWMRVPFGYRTDPERPPRPSGLENRRVQSSHRTADVRLVPGARSDFRHHCAAAHGGRHAYTHWEERLVTKHHKGHLQESRLLRKRLRSLHILGPGEDQKIATRACGHGHNQQAMSGGRVDSRFGA